MGFWSETLLASRSSGEGHMHWEGVTQRSKGSLWALSLHMILPDLSVHGCNLEMTLRLYTGTACRQGHQ